MPESVRPPRAIAWDIIRSEPDPEVRTRAAAEHGGLVAMHVEIFNETAAMRIEARRRRARTLAERAHPMNGYTESERITAQRELDELKDQLDGWILERMREGE